MTGVQTNSAGDLGYQTRALSRALAIIDAFHAEGDPVTVASLHASLDLPKSTIVRLANVLEQYGYVRQRGREYELGPKALELGSVYLQRYGVLDVVRPILESLRDEIGETVCFACLSGSDIVHLDVVPSRHPIQYRTDIGSRAPVHATALGKAILARMDERRVDEVMGDPPYESFTANTLTDRSSLTEDLEATRSRGYSLDLEESMPGLRCIGVALRKPLIGDVAISVSASSLSMTDERIPTFAEAILRTGQLLGTDS